MKKALLDAVGLAAIANALHVGLVVLDEQARIVLWNDWMARHSGLPASDAVGRALRDLFPAAEQSRLVDAVEYAISKGLPSVLSPALQKVPVLPLFQKPEDFAAERRMEQLLHVVPLTPGGVKGCLLQITDMSAAVMRERLLRQQAEALRRAKTQDVLSGLANRKSFDEALIEEFRRASVNQTSLALVMGGIDRFRQFMEAYGKTESEGCIGKIGAAVRDSLPGTECLAARYAPEKFAILLPGLDEETVCILVEELRKAVENLAIPHVGSEHAPHVTISLGVAVITPRSGQDTHSLLSSADIALYHAKQEGRNRGILFSLEDGSFRDCRQVPLPFHKA